MNEDELEIFAALTAFQFMLENLYATMIVQGGGTVADAKATRDEMLRQFEDLPWRPVGDNVDPQVGFQLRQHALARLERMWASIESRVGQAT